MGFGTLDFLAKMNTQAVALEPVDEVLLGSLHQNLKIQLRVPVLVALRAKRIFKLVTFAKCHDCVQCCAEKRFV